jgi:beta-lactamase superfamily II metal-dependent hydrolase
MGIHSIDAITDPFVVQGKEGKFSQVRAVHYGPSGSCGPSHLLVRADAVEHAAGGDEAPMKVAHGRSFEFLSDEMKRATETVMLGGHGRKIPLITPDNLERCLKRDWDAESELGESIRAAMERAEPPSFKAGIPLPPRGRRMRPSRLAVYDVGQGDTISVSFADGTLWLVDAYSWSIRRGIAIKTSMRRWSGRPDIDCMIISHLHYDHIRAAECAIRKLNPREVVFAADFIHKTAAVRNLLTLCVDRGILRVVGTPMSAKFGSTSAKVIPAHSLSTVTRRDSDPNNNGLIIVLETPRASAVLPGDAPGTCLDCLVTDGYVGRAKPTRFYKVTHHCSNTGRCPSFISVFNPTAAVTSCSFGNRYGFPRPEAKALVESATAEFRGSRGHGITYRDRSKDWCLQYVLA